MAHISIKLARVNDLNLERVRRSLVFWFRV